MATINGTSGQDVIVGTAANDEIHGGDGNDRINGGAGDDIIYGDAGNDTLTGDAGNDTLYGGDGNDGFFGGGGNDTIYGGAGDDTMYGDGGNDVFYGGEGKNTYYGGTGDDTFHVTPGTGFNIVAGGSGNDSLALELSSAQLTRAILADLATLQQWVIDKAAAAGSLANQTSQTTGDVLTLNALQLSINAVESVNLYVDGIASQITDLLNHAPAADANVALMANEDTAISGNVGATDADGDALSYAVSSGPVNGTLTLDAATGAYVYKSAGNCCGSDGFDIMVSDGRGGETMQHVDVAIAAVADAPTLSVGNVTLPAGLTIEGTAASETLTGSDASDVITGGAGNDVINGAGLKVMRTFALDIASALTDTDGSETLAIQIVGLPADATLSAGIHNFDGSWTLTAADLSSLMMTASAAVDFTLDVTAMSTEAQNGQSASVTKALSVTFTDLGNNDILDGGDGNDTITGDTGNDTLIDGAGNDNVQGNGGNDTFIVGSGNDIYDGGDGFDTLDFSGAMSSVRVDLSRSLASGQSIGSDKVYSIEGVVGSSWNDRLYGDRGDNFIDGGAGNDTINGGSGNDTLIGGDGNDRIGASTGNDVIYDGAGDDRVNAGSGDDVVFAGSGKDIYYGGKGLDTLDYSFADVGVTIDAGRHTTTGFANDRFSGFEKFVGSAFDDTFLGSSSTDTFIGGSGNDTFRGMGGSDLFSGGAGNDTFEWAVKDVVSGRKYLGYDTISDFTSGSDKLDLSGFSSTHATNFVHMQDTASGTMVSVEIGSKSYDLVMLQDVHGVTVKSLFDAGSIIL
ncbi:MAG: cadherin-like domain-containing protein [Hyphomicrobium sp.]